MLNQLSSYVSVSGGLANAQSPGASCFCPSLFGSSARSRLSPQNIVFIYVYYKICTCCICFVFAGPITGMWLSSGCNSLPCHQGLKVGRRGLITASLFKWCLWLLLIIVKCFRAFRALVMFCHFYRIHLHFSLSNLGLYNYVWWNHRSWSDRNLNESRKGAVFEWMSRAVDWGCNDNDE